MNAACPINSETVNNRVVRVVAGFVVVIATVFLITPQWWLFYLLGGDFLLRALGYRKYSPLATLGRLLVSVLKLEPQPVNAAPKQFAASIGVGFALVAGTLALLDLGLAARVVGGGLLGAASLEAFFGYCVGCKIYSLIPRRTLTRPNVVS
jgi:hypothetical protein